MFCCDGWCCGAAQRKKLVADNKSARVIQRAYKMYLLRRAMLAFAMGAHHRLGPAENLNVDVVDLVLVKVMERSFKPHAQHSEKAFRLSGFES